jgi:Na+-driven multidrug efflux pump
VVTVCPQAGIWIATKPVMLALGVSDRVAGLAQSYSNWSLIGFVYPCRTTVSGDAYLGCRLCRLLPYGIFNALDAYLQTQGTAVPQMVISLIAVGLNFGLNWVLVHGAAGAPGLGFIGSPIATSLSTVVQLLMLLGAMRWRSPPHNPWPVRAFGCCVFVAPPEPYVQPLLSLSLITYAYGHGIHPGLDVGIS